MCDVLTSIIVYVVHLLHQRTFITSRSNNKVTALHRHRGGLFFHLFPYRTLLPCRCSFGTKRFGGLFSLSSRPIFLFSFFPPIAGNAKEKIAIYAHFFAFFVVESRDPITEWAVGQRDVVFWPREIRRVLIFSVVLFLFPLIVLCSSVWPSSQGNLCLLNRWISYGR